MLVETSGDGVHLCCPSRLLQLSPLLSESALHHGGLGEGAVWVLTDEMRTAVGTNVEKLLETAVKLQHGLQRKRGDPNVLPGVQST